MTFLNHIDFHNHDGVNRGMINDFMRNQFYENILAGHVKDQHCIDIGFGTGLLSIIALKHGAKTITAFEADENRYSLGKLVIDQLNLSDKITLINRRFTHDDFSQYPHVTTIFSETVNGNLWQEGLVQSLPRVQGLTFLPGEYFLEIYACTIPEIFAQGLINGRENQGFTPGIDIDQQFVHLVNSIGFPAHQHKDVLPLDTLSVVDPGHDTEWGWIPYLRLCVNTGKLVSGYSVDANQLLTKFVNGPSLLTESDLTTIEFIINTHSWHNQYTLLVPRAGMRHNEHVLYLDTGHWGPTQFPVILNNPAQNVKVQHNLLNGNIDFTLV